MNCPADSWVELLRLQQIADAHGGCFHVSTPFREHYIISRHIHMYRSIAKRAGLYDDYGLRRIGTIGRAI
jgi:hypothetical protein